MWTFLGDHLALILGFAASTIAGLFAYWKSNRSDDKAKDEFLFGSINKVVVLLQEDNKALRERVALLEGRIVQLEARIVGLVAVIDKKEK